MQYLKILGERLTPRDFVRQNAEIRIRAGLLNRFSHLGGSEMTRLS